MDKEEPVSETFTLLRPRLLENLTTKNRFKKNIFGIKDHSFKERRNCINNSKLSDVYNKCLTNSFELNWRTLYARTGYCRNSRSGRILSRNLRNKCLKIHKNK